MAGFAVDVMMVHTEAGHSEPARKGVVQWWYDDRSHYDSPFAFGGLKFDKNGIYQGVKHGEDVVVPSDVYYGGPSGTTSQPVEGLTDEEEEDGGFPQGYTADNRCKVCELPQCEQSSGLDRWSSACGC